MVEISFTDPLRMAGGKSTGCGGEMDMDIFFQVSAKGMVGKKDAGTNPLFVSPILNDSCSDEWDKVHEVNGVVNDQ